MNQSENASRIGGAAAHQGERGARISGRISELRLVTHARLFGMDRLRETCAVATANRLRKRLKTELDSVMLMSMSRKGYELTHEHARVLIDASRDYESYSEREQRLFSNRGIDAWEALNRRRYGASRPPR